MTRGLFAAIIIYMGTEMDRKKVVFKRSSQEDNGFVNATPKERVECVWQLSNELWSLRDGKDAQQRLQRNVTNLIRQPG